MEGTFLIWGHLRNKTAWIAGGSPKSSLEFGSWGLKSPSLSLEPKSHFRWSLTKLQTIEEYYRLQRNVACVGDFQSSEWALLEWSHPSCWCWGIWDPGSKLSESFDWYSYPGFSQGQMHTQDRLPPILAARVQTGLLRLPPSLSRMLPQGLAETELVSLACCIAEMLFLLQQPPHLSSRQPCLLPFSRPHTA